MKTGGGAENGINRTEWINGLVGNFPVAVLNGRHHESSIEPFPAS